MREGGNGTKRTLAPLDVQWLSRGESLELVCICLSTVNVRQTADAGMIRRDDQKSCLEPSVHTRTHIGLGGRNEERKCEKVDGSFRRPDPD